MSKSTYTTFLKIQEIRDFYNLSQRDLAKVFMVSERNIMRWEKKESLPSSEVCRMIFLIHSNLKNKKSRENRFLLKEEIREEPLRALWRLLDQLPIF